MATFLSNLVAVAWALRYVVLFVSTLVAIACALDYRHQLAKVLADVDDLEDENRRLRELARTRHEIQVVRRRPITRGPVLR